MKRMNKITAAFAASLMAATLTVPMMMTSFTASAATIEITGVEQERSFEVYQIFTGTYNATDETFETLYWGAGITQYGDQSVQTDDLVPLDIVNALPNMEARDILAKVQTGSKVNCTPAYDSGSQKVTISRLDEGYYLVKDVTNLSGQDDANSAYIVQVAGGETATQIALKAQKPTVDKQIQDETTDADAGADTEGWGETADHAINESFPFKLLATIPADENLAYYKEYKLVFHDTMSDGVTFEQVDSVKIKYGETEINVDPYNADTDPNGYTTDNTDGTRKDGLTWSLTLADILKNLGEEHKAAWSAQPITVEVVYSAHLNENAIVDTASRTGGTSENTNNNKVYLEYSNNPDSTGTGETGQTTEDYVWAFTYQITNTKYAIEKKDKNLLAGAGFELRTNKDDTNTAIAMEWNATKQAYIPASSGGNKTITSRSEDTLKGTFNIIGLDAGTYYLVETKAPTDYKVADPITITVNATHSEDDAETTASVKLISEGANLTNDVIDKKTSSLPATGGIGTKLFVLCGSALTALGGVFLITKKRMSKKEI